MRRRRVLKGRDETEGCGGVTEVCRCEAGVVGGEDADAEEGECSF